MLLQNLDVFAWSVEDVPGVNPEVITHHLNVDPVYPTVVQHWRHFSLEKHEVIFQTMESLLSIALAHGLHYVTLLANVILVKKASETWLMCVNFTGHNKVCPRDYFLIPHIDQLVNATSGCEMLSFMDAFSDYN